MRYRPTALAAIGVWFLFAGGAFRPAFHSAYHDDVDRRNSSDSALDRGVARGPQTGDVVAIEDLIRGWAGVHRDIVQEAAVISL